MGDEKNETNIVKNWQPPVPLTGSVFCFGRIGSGKSQKILRISQAYHSMGYKIWDCFGGSRSEGGFWTLPSDEKTLWKQFEEETFEFAKDGAKEYQVNLLYPMFSKLLPKELPNLPPRVKSRCFTIPLKEITEADISTVFFPLSSTARILWDKILDELSDKSNGKDLLAYIDIKHPKRKKDAIYNLFIKPLAENHLFSGVDGDLNIDFVAEADDKQTITVLCLDFVPDRYKLFIMKYLTKMIRKMADADKIHKKNILLFREVSLFMKVVDSDKTREEVTQSFRNHFVDLCRYSRSGYFVFCDSQSSDEIKGCIVGSEDLLCVCEMSDPNSKEFTLSPLKRDRRCNEAQIRYISTMPIHQIAVVERGKKMKILKRIQPPRTRGWKAVDGNFFSVWRKEKNEWTNSSHFIDLIKAEYEARNDFILTMQLKNKKKEEEYDEEEEVEEVDKDPDKDEVQEAELKYEKDSHKSTQDTEGEEDEDVIEEKKKLKKELEEDDDDEELELKDDKEDIDKINQETKQEKIEEEDNPFL